MATTKGSKPSHKEAKPLTDEIELLRKEILDQLDSLAPEGRETFVVRAIETIKQAREGISRLNQKDLLAEILQTGGHKSSDIRDISRVLAHITKKKKGQALRPSDIYEFVKTGQYREARGVGPGTNLQLLNFLIQKGSMPTHIFDELSEPLIEIDKEALANTLESQERTESVLRKIRRRLRIDVGTQTTIKDCQNITEDSVPDLTTAETEAIQKFLKQVTQSAKRDVNYAKRRANLPAERNARRLSSLATKPTEQTTDIYAEALDSYNRRIEYYLEKYFENREEMERALEKIEQHRDTESINVTDQHLERIYDNRDVLLSVNQLKRSLETSSYSMPSLTKNDIEAIGTYLKTRSESSETKE